MIDEIVPDVYDVTLDERGGSRYRVFLFDGPTPTLVDAGFADTTDRVLEATDDLEIEPGRLVVTHGDGDHVGGLSSLVAHFDVETWVPRGTDVGDVEPDHRFGDGDDVGQFVAVHTPGHTPAHHALVDETAGLAVLGDSVFGSDVRGLPPGRFVLPPGYYTEDLNTADESLERLLAYEFDVGLVFHGSSVTADAGEILRQFVDFRGKPD